MLDLVTVDPLSLAYSHVIQRIALHSGLFIYVTVDVPFVKEEFFKHLWPTAY